MVLVGSANDRHPASIGRCFTSALTCIACLQHFWEKGLVSGKHCATVLSRTAPSLSVPLHQRQPKQASLPTLPPPWHCAILGCPRLIVSDRVELKATGRFVKKSYQTVLLMVRVKMLPKLFMVPSGGVYWCLFGAFSTGKLHVGVHHTIVFFSSGNQNLCYARIYRPRTSNLHSSFLPQFQLCWPQRSHPHSVCRTAGRHGMYVFACFCKGKGVDQKLNMC